jgi:hypothetical protein
MDTQNIVVMIFGVKLGMSPTYREGALIADSWCKWPIFVALKICDICNKIQISNH